MDEIAPIVKVILRKKRDLEERRKERNHDLIRRARNGESVTFCDAEATWFPQRPTIEKDKQAIKRIYEPQHDEH